MESKVKPVLVAGPPKGGAVNRAPAFYKRRRKRNNEIGQVLIRNGVITPEQLRQALRIQTEKGGHVGAILREMGACDSRAIADALVEQVRVARHKATGLAHRARQNPSIVGLKVQSRPNVARALLVATDLLTLGVAVATIGALLASDTLTKAQQFSVLSLVPMCIAALAAVQMYGLTPPSPSEEIRRCTLTISLIYSGSWLIAVSRPGAIHYMTHGAWLVGWMISVLLVPIGRGVLRSQCAKKSWWGQPVVVLGAGKVGRAVVATLQQRPQLGLKPVAILDDDPAKHGTVRASWGEEDIMVHSVRQGPDSSFAKDDFESPSARSALEQFAEVEGVPVVGGLELAPILAQRLGIRSAVIAMPKLDSATLLSVIERYAEGYSSVLVIPDLFNVAHFGTPTHSLGGVLGIEVRRQLLLAGPRMAKRLMDVALTTLGGLCVLPFVALFAILVKLDSRGSIFYQQKRLGQDGVRFVAFKFRTMYGDGEQRLQEVLAKDPAMRAEYEEFHKLTVDPRVTRIGKFLRKYSLDELPQIWSVFVGDMSLVGPRPYLEREIPDMDGQEAIILRVKPGITGIWQVTERNASSFDSRVQLDVEYVRSWSPWLDLYVLARTLPVVLGGDGLVNAPGPGIKRIRIGTLPVDSVSFEQALDIIDELVQQKSGGTVFTPNVDHVVQAEHDARFRSAYSNVSLSLVDGVPLMWASRWLKTPLPEKISGSDLVLPLMRRAAQRGWRVYFLGGAAGAAQLAKEKLLLEMPSLQIVGIDDGRVDVNAPAEQQRPILERIAQAKPDLLLVALGAPKQELWSREQGSNLNGAVMVCVGASLEFIAGTIRRAPRWMSNAGLEWLYRLLQEPRRLASRYLLRDPQFFRIVARQMRSSN